MSHLEPNLLERYLDGELSREELAAAEAHLASCASCREDLGRLRAIFVELAALPAEPPPVDLTPLVLARIAPPAPWPARAWAILAAQAAFCLALAFWLAPQAIAWANELWAGLAPQLSATLDPRLIVAWAESLAGQANAVARSVQALDTGSLIGLAPTQWALLLGGAALIWLAGNGALLGTRRQEEAPR